MKSKRAVFVRVHEIRGVVSRGNDHNSHQLHCRLFPGEQGSFGKLNGIGVLKSDTTWTFQVEDVQKSSLVFSLHEWCPEDFESARMTLPLPWFRPNFVVREIFPMRMLNNQQEPAMVDLEVHLCENSDLPFQAPAGTLTVRPAWKSNEKPKVQPQTLQTQKNVKIEDLVFEEDEAKNPAPAPTTSPNLSNLPPISAPQTVNPNPPPSPYQGVMAQCFVNFQGYPVFQPPPYAFNSPPANGPNGYPPLVYGIPPPAYYVLPQGVGIAPAPTPPSNNPLPPVSQPAPTPLSNNTLPPVSQPAPKPNTQPAPKPKNIEPKEIVIPEKQLQSEKNAKNSGATLLSEESCIGAISNDSKVKQGDQLDVQAIAFPEDDDTPEFTQEELSMSSKMVSLDLDQGEGSSKSSVLPEMKSSLMDSA